jgi:DNA polymerase III subunit epsilon
VELIGARQSLLSLAEVSSVTSETRGAVQVVRARPEPLSSRLHVGEVEAHRQFVASLGENAIWGDYLPAEGAAGSQSAG